MITSINEYKYNLIQNDFLIFKSIERLNENNTFEWDFTQDIKKDLSLIQKLNLGKDKIIDYFKKVFKQIQKLPENLKIKLFKTIVLTLLTVITSNEINTIISDYFSNDVKIDKTEVRANSIFYSNIIKEVEQNIQKIQEYVRPTEFSDSLVNFLQYEEGDIKQKGKPVLTAYDIGDGMITIGYGHAERKGETKMKAGKTTITEDQALDLLIEDIKEAQRGLDRILNDWNEQNIKPKITQNMYDAMVSMIYNMGIGNFRKSDFIQLVKKGDFELAQEKIKDTNVTYPGHVPRREKESLIFSSNDYKDIENKLYA